MKNKLSKRGHCWCQCQFNLVTRYFHTKSFLQLELLIVQWGSENQTLRYWKRNVLKFWFRILNGWQFKKRSMVSLGRFTYKYFIYLNKPRLKTKQWPTIQSLNGIRKLDKGRPFKNLTRPVFGSPLYMSLSIIKFHPTRLRLYKDWRYIESTRKVEKLGGLNSK